MSVSENLELCFERKRCSLPSRLRNHHQNYTFYTYTFSWNCFAFAWNDGGKTTNNTPGTAQRSLFRCFQSFCFLCFNSLINESFSGPNQFIWRNQTSKSNKTLLKCNNLTLITIRELISISSENCAIFVDESQDVINRNGSSLSEKHQWN